MALVSCPECKKEISDTANACPSCGYEMKSSGKQLCSKCNIEAIPFKKKNSVSAGGILGALLFIIALPILFFNLLIGVVVIILALILGTVGRGEHIEMVCPKCKKVLSKIE